MLLTGAVEGTKREMNVALNEEGDERGLEPVMSFADTHIAYETLF